MVIRQTAVIWVGSVRGRLSAKVSSTLIGDLNIVIIVIIINFVYSIHSPHLVGVGLAAIFLHLLPIYLLIHS